MQPVPISPLTKLKNALSSAESELNGIQRLLQLELEKDKQDTDTLTILFQKLYLTEDQIKKYRDSLERLYEEELKKLSETDKDRVSGKEKKQMASEVKELDSLLGTDIFDTSKEITSDDVASVISQLPTKFQEKCPLVFNVIETLLLTKPDGSIQKGKRVLDAVHAIALLSSLKSQKVTNDIKWVFTIMCIS